MKQFFVSISLFLLCLSLNGQNFSQTFDEILVSNERGNGMWVESNGEIYVNVGMVCQDLTQSCSMTYKFDSSGNLIWKKLIDNFNSLNWETVQVENDSVYLGITNFTATPNDYISQVVFDKNTG